MQRKQEKECLFLNKLKRIDTQHPGSTPRSVPKQLKAGVQRKT